MRPGRHVPRCLNPIGGQELRDRVAASAGKRQRVRGLARSDCGPSGPVTSGYFRPRVGREEDLERQLIAEALRSTGSNRQQAAKALA
jgi:hypothetical protein